MPDIEIKPLSPSPDIRASLSEMLIEAVAHGGSVSFMHPLPSEVANAFWEKSLAAAARGERIVLGAFDGEQLVGTVTLVLDLAPNQPHRAEIAKMITRVSHRGRGVATALLRAAETHGDRSTGAGCSCSTPPSTTAPRRTIRARRLQAGRRSFRTTRCKPHGGLTGTMFYWKRIADDAAVS